MQCPLEMLDGSGQFHHESGQTHYMGLSENRVPLNPMVNDHYPYKMAIIGNIPYFQTNPYNDQKFHDRNTIEMRCYKK